MKKTMTCIVCPIGCEITVEHENGSIASISGNTCKRGEAYAKNEILSPSRTLTTTVRIEGGSMPLVPVRTDKPIPKAMLFKAMEQANACIAKAPIKCGDVIIADFVENGTNLIACRSIDSSN